MARDRFDLHAHPQLRGFRPDAPGRLPGAGDAYPESEFRDAGMLGVTFATISDAAVLGFDGAGGLRAVREFAPGEAYADHRRQVSGLLDYAARAGLTVLRDGADLRRARESDRTGMLLACEGADFVEDDIEHLTEAYERGVRVVGLVHYAANRFGDTQTEAPRHGGLSAAGQRLVRKADGLGMIIDVAHATFDTVRGVLEVAPRAVMLSHSHLARGEDSHPRLLAAAHAQAVASTGGLIGAWPSGVASRDLGDFADEIVRLVDAVGADHVGIGTDLDGNYRPVLTRYAQFDDLTALLGARGMDAAETAAILGGNAVAFVERALS